MARKPEIWYINSAVCGSSAYQLETKPAQKKQVKLPKPKARRAKKTVIAIDPVAILSIGVAMALLISMVVGFVRLQEAREEAVLLNRYVNTLQTKNEQLLTEYKSGYDLEEIQQIATAMGKVPATQVEQITVEVHVPVEEPEMNTWERIYAFVTGLFA